MCILASVQQVLLHLEIILIYLFVEVGLVASHSYSLVCNLHASQVKHFIPFMMQLLEENSAKSICIPLEQDHYY